MTSIPRTPSLVILRDFSNLVTLRDFLKFVTPITSVYTRKFYSETNNTPLVYIPSGHTYVSLPFTDFNVLRYFCLPSSHTLRECRGEEFYLGWEVRTLYYLLFRSYIILFLFYYYLSSTRSLSLLRNTLSGPRQRFM